MNRRSFINSKVANSEKKTRAQYFSVLVNICQSQKTGSPTKTIVKLNGKNEVCFSYLVHIVHPTQHVKVGVELIQHPYDVHRHNFVVGT